MPGNGSSSSARHPATAILTSVFIAVFMAVSGPAYALTDFVKPETQQSKDKDTAEPSSNPDDDEDQQYDDAKPGMPMPDPLINKADPKNKQTDEDKDDEKADEPTIPAEIILDANQLPEPVKKLRIAIVEAAASGDIERLRPLLGTGADATQVAVGDAPEDPIAALKSLSGDKEGREVLGILLDIISTSAARVDKGTPNEMYVWPYFAEKKLDSLSPPEIVELYRIVTAADVADMKEFGAYNFYRIGISPDGKWKFFVAGD
jgi:hypothetical protein